MAHQSDSTSYTTMSDSPSTESCNPNREEIGVDAATSSHARRPKETVSRISSAIALDKPSKEGSRYMHNAIASIVTKILSGDQNVPGVSVPLNTIIPDEVACRETAVVVRENVSGIPEEGPKNDKPVNKVRGEKVSVTQGVDDNPRTETVNLEEFSDNELLASVIPSIAKRVRTGREKKTVVQRSPTKEVDETTSPKQAVTESARKRKGHGPAKSWSKERLALERELAQNALECKEIVDLIKEAGLMRIVNQLPKCYETLVKEFIVNLSEECADGKSREFRKVYVRDNDFVQRRESPLAFSYKLFLGKHVPYIVMTPGETSNVGNHPEKVVVIAVLRETCKELEARKHALEKLISQLEASAEDTDGAARQSSEDEKETRSDEEVDDEAEE
ncbi:uncharacterized protein LOC127136777 [Lathyrus oleraceus]|uniref:uncharacterized protein LOC127136777 n=1 Tax=Pisum sativum TaxID=3888 RepID=UPI0021CE835C|nr:uncharacterized protein LOC127136777 [Pisum sativum]